MFYLTPQEKNALAVLLAVCLLGALIHCAFAHKIKAVRWVETAAHKPDVYRPDLNTATAEQIDRIPGIGLKTAQNIVAYRKTHGRLSSLKDLRQVKGITKKNFLKVVEFYQGNINSEKK